MFLVSRTDCVLKAQSCICTNTQSIVCVYVCNTDLYIDINDETLG